MRHKTYKLSEKKILKLCKEALENFECKILDSDDDMGKIEAKKGGNLLSYGNKIIIEIDSQNNESEIRIASKSVGPQVLDWGTNNEIEEELFQRIDDLLS